MSNIRIHIKKIEDWNNKILNIMDYEIKEKKRLRLTLQQK